MFSIPLRVFGTSSTHLVSLWRLRCFDSLDIEEVCRLLPPMFLAKLRPIFGVPLVQYRLKSLLQLLLIRISVVREQLSKLVLSSNYPLLKGFRRPFTLLCLGLLLGALNNANLFVYVLNLKNFPTILGVVWAHLSRMSNGFSTL